MSAVDTGTCVWRIPNSVGIPGHLKHSQAAFPTVNVQVKEDIICLVHIMQNLEYIAQKNELFLLNFVFCILSHPLPVTKLLTLVKWESFLECDK